MSIDQALKDAVAEAIAPLVQEVRALRQQQEHTISPQWVSRAEAAQVLGCCAATVDRMVRSNAVVWKKLGRSVRIDRASLRAPSQDEVDAEVWRARVAR